MYVHVFVFDLFARQIFASTEYVVFLPNVMQLHSVITFNIRGGRSFQFGTNYFSNNVFGQETCTFSRDLVVHVVRMIFKLSYYFCLRLHSRWYCIPKIDLFHSYLRSIRKCASSCLTNVQINIIFEKLYISWHIVRTYWTIKYDFNKLYIYIIGVISFLNSIVYLIWFVVVKENKKKLTIHKNKTW